MTTPDWRNLIPGEGVLAKPVRDDNRLVLWVRAEQDDAYLYWDRIVAPPRAEAAVGQGLRTVPVSSIRARQRTGGGLLDRLARRFSSGGESWTLPNGQTAEKCGPRRTDLLLVWPEDEAAALPETAILERWPGLSQWRRISDRVALVVGVGAEDHPASGGDHQDAPGTEEPGSPTALAERLLADARQGGDRAREAAALTDLGLAALNEGQLERAVNSLNEALELARQLGDPARQADALSNLGYALLAAGQAPLARQALDQALTLARQQNDAYTEKLILERLGMAHANLRDPAGALRLLDQALEMTRAAGDQQQEARILWHQAITLADMDQRDPAIEKAQESIDLLRKQGKPEASWYGAQLQRYRMDFATHAGAGLGPGGSLPGALGGSITTAAPAAIDPQSGPGLLRMAVSATRAMMKFIGSGLKATSPELQRRRMATCQACVHHTGLRCRICGCFTNVKTRMAHEQCPIGKWPG